MPTMIFFDDEEEDKEFEGFHNSKNNETFSDLHSYFKENTSGNIAIY